MEHGTGLKRGLLTLAKEKGLDWCLGRLDEYQHQFGERFRPSWLLRKLVRAKVHDLSNYGAAPVAVR